MTALLALFLAFPLAGPSKPPPAPRCHETVIGNPHGQHSTIWACPPPRLRGKR